MLGIQSLKIGCLLTLAAAVSLAPAVAQAVQDYSNIRVVRLSLAEGDVFVQHLGEEAPGAAAMRNMPIRHGDTITVEQGLAEVEFENGAMLRLPDYSAVEFTELALADGRRITRVTLLNGTASIHAELSRGEIFQIRTPHLEVEASNRSVFRIDVQQDQTYVTVTRGDVRVETAEGSHRVSRGRSLNFGPATSFQARSDGRPEDEWDRWVEQRHREVTAAASASLRYARAPLRYGMAELSNYGQWVRVGFGSGFAWRPYGVGYGWMPFVYGSWQYLPGLGWYWASADPWGWLPYHFGWWYYSNLYGWLWMPDSYWYWRPGHVRWFHYNGRLCWAPYSPYDRPGLPPYHSPVGCAVERPGGPDTPRGIRGAIARLNPEEKPVPLDGPPAAPPELERSQPRGIRGALDRAGQRRDGETYYDPDTGTIVNRNRPAVGIRGTPAPRDSGEAAPPVGAPTEPPRRGIRGALPNPEGAPLERGRPAWPADASRPQTPRDAPSGARPSSPRGEPRPVPQAEPRPAPPPRSDPPAPRVEPRPVPQVEPRPAPPPPPRVEPRPERPQPQASRLTSAGRPQAAPRAPSPQPAAGAAVSRPPAEAAASRPSTGGIRGAAQASRPQPRSRPNPN